jgi:hypothetical protein
MGFSYSDIRHLAQAPRSFHFTFSTLAAKRKAKSIAIRSCR